MDSFEQLFGAFQPSDKATWKEKVIADLKGKAYEELIWKDEDGILHQPYYDRSDLKDHFPQIYSQDRAWKIVQTYYLTYWKLEELKSELKRAFANGLQKAIVISDEFQMEVAEGLNGLDNVFYFAKSSSLEKEHFAFKGRVLDPIGAYVNQKEYSKDHLTANFHLLQEKDSFLLVDGLIYAERGGSAVQEVAYTLWHLVDYFDQLTEAGIHAQEIADRIIVRTSIGPSYFSQLSKFRALRLNIERIFDHYNVSSKPKIWADSNPFYLDDQNYNNNLIRLSCQAMSAVLGNCDWISLTTEGAEIVKKEFASRMNRNIQLLLKHESHLDEVDDLVRGAYYIESLTNELSEKSWNTFLSLESKGTLLANAKAASFWADFDSKRAEEFGNYKKGIKSFIGVNKYTIEGRMGSEETMNSVEDSLSKELRKKADV